MNFLQRSHIDRQTNNRGVYCRNIYNMIATYKN